MRKPIMAGNWKMHKNIDEALTLVKELKEAVGSLNDVEMVVCPPFLAIPAIKKAFPDVKVGAQNLFWEEKGAFTGEISPTMLKSAACDYVIIGHSERRQYFGETDESVNKKVKAALKHDLLPIVCVGETLEEREAQITEKVVSRQIRGGLVGLSSNEVKKIVVAYEPVWAIGTGKTASDDDANAVCSFIRKELKELFGAECAEEIRIQYGGSVKPDNVQGLMAKSDIDGALVGGASLDALSFSKIVKFR